MPNMNIKKIGLILGPLLCLIVGLLPTPEDMQFSAKIVGAIALWMAIWWISEAVPFPVTALIPLGLFPVFQIMPVSSVTTAYSHHIIFLFLSGFIFALCIERWQLHKRLALNAINQFGFQFNRILLGFMIASAFLSMWVSNTATTLMMIPIATAVASQLDPKNTATNYQVFSISLLLGIAYSASIGGAATLIGTPPNAIMAGMLEKQAGITISFFDWMLFALPLATVFLIITWFYLSYKISASKLENQIGSKEIIQQQLSKLAPMSYEEKCVSVIFFCVCLSWILRGFINWEWLSTIKDATIGIIGAIILFVVPAKNKNTRLMDWETTKKLPWGILILFGGGFALASGFEQTELTTWMATKFTLLEGTSLYIIIFSIVFFVIFLTEITSNTATATLLIPIMIALSSSLNQSPLLLSIAVAVATSYAFMLPVATPPNAIVFASGRVPIQKMAKTGFWLNIIGSGLITFFVLSLIPIIFPQFN